MEFYSGHDNAIPITLYCLDHDSIPVSQDTMIDEQSSASEQDHASDRSAIGAGVILGMIALYLKHVCVFLIIEVLSLEEWTKYLADLKRARCQIGKHASDCSILSIYPIKGVF